MSSAPKVFDRDLIAHRLARRSPQTRDFVTALVLDDLEERLITVTRDFRHALIMAPDATPLPERGETRSGPFSYDRVSTIAETAGFSRVDPERLELPRADYDLIVSILDLQAINDVPGFLARVRAHLAPDGLFLAAALGGSTLTELRQAFLVADAELLGGAAGRVAPFIEVRDAGGLLQRAGFALPVADVETHIVRYSGPLALMRELKALGASNPLADRPERMAIGALIAAAATHYAERASDPDGRIRATLEIVWMSGWVPHESQQKPLARGSAQVSLKDVLKRP
jgi:hypothetical protein